jgi:uncharacterized cupin superfamily protein
MTFNEIEEAKLVPGDGGLEPAGDGWFIVNVAQGRAFHTSRFGHACVFEGTERFPEFGINVQVLEPGQPSGLYHRENAQEAFLVLSGECLAIVEGQERSMQTGDLLHSPPGTAHILVGAGAGPCTVLMVGTREGSEDLEYPVDAIAASHFAAAEHETTDAKVAYAGVSTPTPRAIGSVPW